MAQQKITTTYYHEPTDQNLTVVGILKKGIPAPPQNFDRFREPDDPDEMEITDILSELGASMDTYMFTDAELQDMETALFDAI